MFSSPKDSLQKNLQSQHRAGVNPDNVYHFSDVDEMKRFFDSFLIPNDIVYFKTGGRDPDIEDVIKYLSS